MLTQDEYKLFTGESISYSEEYWKRLVSNAQRRLASYLCLPNWPSKAEDDLLELLANFMCAVFNYQGSNQKVASKTIRNFSISFRQNEASNAFEQLSNLYSDTIARYSKCGSGVSVERSTVHYDDYI